VIRSMRLSDLGIDTRSVSRVTEYRLSKDLAIKCQRIDLTGKARAHRQLRQIVLPGLDPTPVDAVKRLTTTLPAYPRTALRSGVKDQSFASPVRTCSFAPVIGSNWRWQLSRTRR